MSRKSMSFKRLAIACLAAVAVGAALPASGVTTNTFYVSEGQTLTVDQVVAASNFTFAAGDWLRKPGPGTLNAVTTYKDTKINLLIEEGVYYVGGSDKKSCHKGGATLIIKAGATVNVDGKTTHQFDDSWTVYFEGNGTGEGDNLGAICIGGSQTNPTIATGGNFYMTGDATIYTYGTMNAVFSGNTSSGGPTLNMNGHTLTILGKTSSSVFRPRWYWAIRTSGPIIVRNGQFARHLTTTSISPNIPLISFTDGALMAAYSDATTSPWYYVNAFAFDAGAKIGKGNGSPDTATMSIKKLTGPVDISAADVTISQEFGVRGTDMANGDKLTSANTLTFADGCKLSVTNWGAVSLSPGTTHTVATSSVGITGTPVPDGAAAPVFTVANTGNAITLTVKDGIIDVVRDWGVQPGAENAAANTAAVAAHVAEVTDNVVIYFPAGDYWFTDTCDLSSVTASGVTVWNPEQAAVLHSGIALGAASNMTVRGIVFKECAGPAVVATGTAGLVIDDCVVDNVAGTYAGGHYPFAAVNVTGFNLKGTTWKADEAIWDGQAYFDGGTAETLSEAYTNAVVVNVTANGWVFWNDATNSLGLTASAYNGKTLRKIGTGTFDPQNVGVSNVNIAAVEILQGQYVARANAHLGKPKGPVHVCDGACLTLAGSTKNALSRTITISGRGYSRENPAVRFSSSVTWDKTDSVTWVLEGDATMYSAKEGENGTFLWGTVHTHGHTLTLDGISTANYRFGRSIGWYEGGTVVVSNVILSASSSGNSDHTSSYKLKDNIVPKFIFRNGARLVPDDDDIFTVVKDCEFEKGTKIAPKYADVPVTFTNLTGAPTGTVNAATITITGKYTARAAEVSAGTHAIFSGALAFGANATAELDDPTIPLSTHTLFTAAGGISGKPVTTGATAAAGWSVFKRGANMLCIGPMPGTILVVR
ncbi:MAG: hypothetical protein IJJ84_16115 [Kiritimatiellae bacterium]|nr:hypothetical protein [Kiritimatiellia bacterium]